VQRETQVMQICQLTLTWPSSWDPETRPKWFKYRSSDSQLSL